MYDVDDDADGVCTAKELQDVKDLHFSLDTDGDGLYNYLDADDDNDGQLTLVEEKVWENNKITPYLYKAPNASDVQKTDYLTYTEQQGFTNYELTNHLGNVMAVITDAPEAQNNTLPTVKSYADYWPFGAPLSIASGGEGYRFGFGGHENDPEPKGDGNFVDFGNYGLDVRIGRRWQQDPMAHTFPWESPYSTFFNNPINLVDKNGEDPTPNKYIMMGNAIVNFFKYRPTRINNKVVIDNDYQAVLHYYRGNGENVVLGKTTIALIKNSKDIKKYTNNIVNGITTSPSGPKGKHKDSKLAVHMELEDLGTTFHLGDMQVDYSTKCTRINCVTKFTVDDAGFVDPNYIYEYLGEGLGKLGIDVKSLKPDKQGSNLELGGTPYDYAPIKWEIKYKNPGYEIDEKGNPLPIEKKSKTIEKQTNN